jgi:hypothetical protein
MLLWCLLFALVGWLEARAREHDRPRLLINVAIYFGVGLVSCYVLVYYVNIFRLLGYP